MFGQVFTTGDAEGDAAVAMSGDQFQLNSTTSSTQNDVSVVTLADGKFVATWYNAGNSDIRAQIFDGDGSKLGSEIAVTEYYNYGYSQPSITALADGGFAVAAEKLEVLHPAPLGCRRLGGRGSRLRRGSGCRRRGRPRIRRAARSSADSVTFASISRRTMWIDTSTRSRTIDSTSLPT